MIVIQSHHLSRMNTLSKDYLGFLVGLLLIVSIRATNKSKGQFAYYGKMDHLSYPSFIIKQIDVQF